MIKFLCFLLCTFFTVLAGNSQVDLVITQAQVSSTVLNKGGYLVVGAVVQNVGSTTSIATNVSFHLTTDSTIDNNDKIGELFISALSPQQSDTLNFIYSIPPNFNSGSYNAAVWVDPIQINIESSVDNNAICVADNQGCQVIFISQITEVNKKLPYPVLFVHGLVSNDKKAWENAISNLVNDRNLIFGGKLTYCLNPDGDLSTSDGSILDFVDSNQLTNGDIYTINFDVNNSNIEYVSDDFILLNDDFSNQSAIFKQGGAVGDAVTKILNVTGNDEVILVGHSMGGLAIRHYIQSDFLHVDGQHNIAKIHTSDTPHGGSNVGQNTLAEVFNFNGIDIRSEAVRDLRFDEFNNLIFGTFIDGGPENIAPGFYYNDDVNINGTDTDLIEGINNMSSPQDISYSCSIAKIPDFPFDIVEESKADLNNGYIYFDFPYITPIIPRIELNRNHSNINNDFYGILQGLDEPQDPNLAFELKLDEVYNGYTTIQASNMILTNDVDYFKVDIESDGVLSLDIFNTNSPWFTASIYDEDINEVFYSGKIDHSFQEEVFVTSGIWYIRLEGTPTQEELPPYYIGVSYSPKDELNASFSSNTNEVCIPNEVQFMDQSQGDPTSYSWTFEGGTPNTSDEANPVIVYETPGKYNVTLVTSNEFGSDLVTVDEYIVVDDIPDPDFIPNISNENSVLFSVTSNSYDPNTQYLWDFGDGNSSDVAFTSPIHIYEESGVYDITFTIENFCGSNSITKQVVINISEELNAKFESNITIGCEPDQIEYFDNSVGNPTEWLWEFQGGTPSMSTEQNPIITYQNQGTYNTKLSVSNSLYSDEIDRANYVEIYSEPVALIDYITTSSSQIDFINNSLIGNSNAEFDWDFGDGNTSTNVSPSHTYTEQGDFLVTLTVTNECGTSVSEELITIMTTSTSEILSQNGYKIFPNPNSGTFYLSNENGNSISNFLTLTLMDLAGRELNLTSNISNNVLFLECGDLATGMYVLKLDDGLTISYLKFLIIN